VAAAALVNTKWSDNTLATVKATFDNFISKVLGKMESEFDKQTNQTIAASVAISIATSEYGFNKGAQDIHLSSDGDSDFQEIDSDEF
jgi:hypothetical protein